MEEGGEVGCEVCPVREEVRDRFCVRLAILQEFLCRLFDRLEAARIVVELGVGRLCALEGQG